MKAFWLDQDRSISAEELASEGVYYAQLSTEEARYAAPVAELKRTRGYIEQDIVELSSATPNLDAICAKFVDEHSHDDDEVRFVLQGEGIFDIRSRDDRYMRVEVVRGDLIVVPKDRHHRFMLTESKAIRCVRLFKDKSGWTPNYRASAQPAE
jgi:1,2-dihydroxy-3-keto-5-methylthiopentene dioxygenase